jgi:tetratricopeptide (TPR) repeat protein
MPRALVRELERSARGPHAAEALKWMERSLRARARGRTAEARRAAVRAKQAAPRSPSVREALGLAAYDLEEWHEAAQELLAYRRLTGSRSHDPVIAGCHVALGRPERALDLLADIDVKEHGEGLWARAQAVRARALAATGRAAEARNILRAAARRTRSDRARQTLERAATEL